MLTRLLNEDRLSDTLKADVCIDKIVEMLYSGLLVAIVMYASDKSFQNLGMTISTLVGYLTQIDK